MIMRNIHISGAPGLKAFTNRVFDFRINYSRGTHSGTIYGILRNIKAQTRVMINNEIL